MPRREERRRLMLLLPLMRSMLKRLLLSKKNQLLLRKSSPSLPQPLRNLRLISLPLLMFKRCHQSTKIFSLPSIWEMLRLLRVLLIINHLHKRTPLRVVMPPCSSNQLQQTTSSSLFMRISSICKLYTRTLRLSDYSH